MTLLEMVDLLLGDILRGNLYTNNSDYLKNVVKLQSPPNTFGVSNSQSPLNFNKGDAHPHAGSPVIPPPPHGPPPIVRGAMYQQGIDNKSISEQSTNIQSNVTPPPRDVIGQQTRDKIYLGSNSLNRVAGPLSDLLDFHESKTHPHGQPRVIPNSGDPSGHPLHRPDGLAPSQHGVPPNPPPTPENYDAGQTPLRNWDNMEGVKREQIYKDNQVPPDVIMQKQTLASDPKFDVGGIPRADLYKNVAGSNNQAPSSIHTNISPKTEGDRLAGQGTVPPLATNQDFKNPERNDLYNNFAGSDNKVPSFIHTNVSPKTMGDSFAAKSTAPPPLSIQKGDDVPTSLFLNQEFKNPESREEFYKNFAGSNNQVPSKVHTNISPKTEGDRLASQGLSPKIDLKYLEQRGNASLAESFARSEQNRRDIFLASSRAGLSNVSSQLGLRASTVSDQLTANGAVPPSLAFNKGDAAPARRTIVPVEGQLRNDLGTDSHRLGNLYDDNGINLNPVAEKGGRFPMFTSPAPSQFRFFDVYAIAHWLRNIGRETGLFPIQDNNDQGKVQRPAEMISKGVTFLASQFLLAAGNPGGITLPGMTEQQETNISPANAIYNPSSLLVASIPLMRGSDAATITAEGLASNYKQDLLIRVISNTDVMSMQSVRGTDQFVPPPYPYSDAPGLNAATTDVGFNPFDEAFGVINAPLEEGALYFPFMFQDLRDNPPEYLYFRAFLKPGLVETFAPDWQLDSYYGRVDNVPTYKGTTRNISLSFDVVAWSPKDLKVMYKKMKKLQSMVYPLYDTHGFMQSAPIVRMRIGDLFATSNNQGIPGYITSLDLSFDDGIWNIQTDQKVPRVITVSLGFTVLHDGNPGIYQYSEAQLFSTGEINTADEGGKFFGVGKFEDAGNGDTHVTVTEADMRKVFGAKK